MLKCLILIFTTGRNIDLIITCPEVVATVVLVIVVCRDVDVFGTKTVTFNHIL
jgi:hypothetical protein